MENENKRKLDERKSTILKEIPYIDIKKYSHNIISLQLTLISQDFGVSVSNQLIKDFKLDTKGWCVVE